MPLNTENRCLKCQWMIIVFFVGSIFKQRGHLNSDVGILDLFFVTGVVVVGGGVEASSEAW